MQTFMKKNLGILGLLGLLLIASFALRLPHLTLLPIFADEAIYIRWAQIMRAEPTLRFVSMMDGKTPLFMWVMIPFFKIFSDPLLAGRFLSVLSGLGTVSGVLFIGWFLFNKRVGFWAAFLVTITPFFIFFDRMALVDSMLCAFSVWSIALALILIKFPRWDLAMILGYLMGGALLTKTPGFFTVVTMPLTVLTFPFRKSGRQGRIIKLFLLWMVAIVITVGIYNILRLGPGFSNLNSRNQDYVLSPTSTSSTELC
jgi:4-amino-4-deoxy-L-arabinose transferase-like glycosyltransferase